MDVTEVSSKDLEDGEIRDDSFEDVSESSLSDMIEEQKGSDISDNSLPEEEMDTMPQDETNTIPQDETNTISQDETNNSPPKETTTFIEDEPVSSSSSDKFDEEEVKYRLEALQSLLENTDFPDKKNTKRENIGMLNEEEQYRKEAIKSLLNRSFGETKPKPSTVALIQRNVTKPKFKSNTLKKRKKSKKADNRRKKRSKQENIKSEIDDSHILEETRSFFAKMNEEFREKKRLHWLLKPELSASETLAERVMPVLKEAPPFVHCGGVNPKDKERSMKALVSRKDRRDSECNLLPEKEHKGRPHTSLPQIHKSRSRTPRKRWEDRERGSSRNFGRRIRPETSDNERNYNKLSEANTDWVTVSGVRQPRTPSPREPLALASPPRPRSRADSMKRPIIVKALYTKSSSSLSSSSSSVNEEVRNSFNRGPSLEPSDEEKKHKPRRDLPALPDLNSNNRSWYPSTQWGLVEMQSDKSADSVKEPHYEMDDIQNNDAASEPDVDAVLNPEPVEAYPDQPNTSTPFEPPLPYLQNTNVLHETNNKVQTYPRSQEKSTYKLQYTNTTTTSFHNKNSYPVPRFVPPAQVRGARARNLSKRNYRTPPVAAPRANFAIQKRDRAKYRIVNTVQSKYVLRKPITKVEKELVKFNNESVYSLNRVKEKYPQVDPKEFIISLNEEDSSKEEEVKENLAWPRVKKIHSSKKLSDRDYDLFEDKSQIEEEIIIPLIKPSQNINTSVDRNNREFEVIKAQAQIGAVIPLKPVEPMECTPSNSDSSGDGSKSKEGKKMEAWFPSKLKIVNSYSEYLSHMSATNKQKKVIYADPQGPPTSNISAAAEYVDPQCMSDATNFMESLYNKAIAKDNICFADSATAAQILPLIMREYASNEFSGDEHISNSPYNTMPRPDTFENNPAIFGASSNGFYRDGHTPNSSYNRSTGSGSRFTPIEEAEKMLGFSPFPSDDVLSRSSPTSETIERKTIKSEPRDTENPEVPDPLIKFSPRITFVRSLAGAEAGRRMDSLACEKVVAQGLNDFYPKQDIEPEIKPGIKRIVSESYTPVEKRMQPKYLESTSTISKEQTKSLRRITILEPQGPGEYVEPQMMRLSSPHRYRPLVAQPQMEKCTPLYVAQPQSAPPEIVERPVSQNQETPIQRVELGHSSVYQPQVEKCDSVLETQGLAIRVAQPQGPLMEIQPVSQKQELPIRRAEPDHPSVYQPQMETCASVLEPQGLGIRVAQPQSAPPKPQEWPIRGPEGLDPNFTCPPSMEKIIVFGPNPYIYYRKIGFLPDFEKLYPSTYARSRDNPKETVQIPASDREEMARLRAEDPYYVHVWPPYPVGYLPEKEKWASILEPEIFETRKIIAKPQGWEPEIFETREITAKPQGWEPEIFETREIIAKPQGWKPETANRRSEEPQNDRNISIASEEGDQTPVRSASQLPNRDTHEGQFLNWRDPQGTSEENQNKLEMDFQNEKNKTVSDLPLDTRKFVQPAKPMTSKVDTSSSSFARGNELEKNKREKSPLIRPSQIVIESENNSYEVTEDDLPTRIIDHFPIIKAFRRRSSNNQMQCESPIEEMRINKGKFERNKNSERMVESTVSFESEKSGTKMKSKFDPNTYFDTLNMGLTKGRVEFQCDYEGQDMETTMVQSQSDERSVQIVSGIRSMSLERKKPVDELTEPGELSNGSAPFVHSRVDENARLNLCLNSSNASERSKEKNMLSNKVATPVTRVHDGNTQFGNATSVKTEPNEVVIKSEPLDESDSDYYECEQDALQRCESCGQIMEDLLPHICRQRVPYLAENNEGSGEETASTISSNSSKIGVKGTKYRPASKPSQSTISAASKNKIKPPISKSDSDVLAEAEKDLLEIRSKLLKDLDNLSESMGKNKVELEKLAVMDKKLIALRSAVKKLEEKIDEQRLKLRMNNSVVRSFFEGVSLRTKTSSKLKELCIAIGRKIIGPEYRPPTDLEDLIAEKRSSVVSKSKGAISTSSKGNN